MPNESTPEAIAPEDEADEVELEDGATPPEVEDETPEADEDAETDEPEGTGDRLSQLMSILDKQGTKEIPDPDGDDEPEPIRVDREAKEEADSPEAEAEETEVESEPTAEPTGDQPSEDAEESDEEEHDRPAPKRLWLKSLPDESRADVSAVVELMRAKPHLTVAEAAAIVAGVQAPGAPAAEQANEAPKVEDLQAKIDALDDEIAVAIENIDGKKVTELRKQQRALEKQINEREAADRQSRATAQSSHEQAVSESYQRAVAGLPDTVKAEGKPNAEVQAALDAEVARIHAINPDFFNDPEWPETVAAKVSHKLGLAKPAPIKAGVKPVPVAKPKAAPTLKAKPTPGPDRGGIPTRPANPAAAHEAALQREIAAARKLGPKAMAEVLARHGTRNLEDSDD